MWKEVVVEIMEHIITMENMLIKICNKSDEKSNNKKRQTKKV